MYTAFIAGFGIGGGLIIAIGAQNAFVLSQGLRRSYPVMVAFVCALCDALLILAGVAGLGALIAASPFWTNLMAWGGAAFLFWYGFRAFRSLLSEDHALNREKGQGNGRMGILSATLAITLLNPHVYLDTVVLVGTIAAQYEDTLRPYFALGAISASFAWFFTISLGAAWASPYLARPATWKVIDGLTGVVMWTVAISLIT